MLNFLFTGLAGKVGNRGKKVINNPLTEYFTHFHNVFKKLPT